MRKEGRGGRGERGEGDREEHTCQHVKRRGRVRKREKGGGRERGKVRK